MSYWLIAGNGGWKGATEGIIMKYAIVVLIAIFVLSRCINNRAAVPDVEDIDIQNQESSGAQADEQMSEVGRAIAARRAGKTLREERYRACD